MDTTTKKKILVIDDDASLLVTLSDLFAFEGYDVTTAESGEAGLVCLETMTPDLIVLDMSMPGMGGVGFLKEISQPDGKPRYPVLVLTARAGMAEFFANVDVEGFVAKPCVPDDLLAEVNRIIFLRSGAGSGLSSSSGRAVTALVADGDLARRTAIRAALQGAGMEVVDVQRGPEVLERSIVERPALIVLAWDLPSMKSDAVAKMLKEMGNTRDIPILLHGIPEEIQGSMQRLVEQGVLVSALGQVDAASVARAAAGLVG